MPQISGRVVNSLDDVTVQEVPTDGTVALFPSADGKCIYSKRWTPDDNIATMRFVPEASEAEYYDSVIDAMENGQRYGYDGQGSNAVGRQGYRESYIMDNNGDGEGRMGYRNQYGNFPANPKNRRRMCRSGYSEESIDNIRQMMEDADPERKRQLKRDLEDLMSEM